MSNKEIAVELTEAEARMMMEAVAMWACEISTVRHSLHSDKIKSVFAKLQNAVQAVQE